MNAVIFGRIGTNAKLIEKGDHTLAQFSVALSFYKKGDKPGTQWVNTTLFGSRAVKVAQHLTKGTEVAVTGDLHVRIYERNDGETGVSLDLNAESITLLSYPSRI